MPVNEIIIIVLMVFMVLGALDRAIGNRFGLGEQFEAGFRALGPLALSMVGMISLIPVLAKLLQPLVVPVYRVLGADPAMFAGTLISIDMGGYALAMELAENEDAGLLAGTILASTLGCTLSYTIPVALGVIRSEDRPIFAKGILTGIVAVPLGVLVAGLVAGFDLGLLASNLVPIVITAALIAIGMWRFPEQLTVAFLVFGKILVAVISIALAVATWEFMTGIRIMPDGWELTPVTEGLRIVGFIGLVLLGAFPAVHVAIRLARRPLAVAGRWLGISEVSSGGLIVTLANSLPMMQMIGSMDARGKLVNSAFVVNGIALFGAHLGFTAGVAPRMLVPMMVGKLVAGAFGVALVLMMFGRQYPAAQAEPSR